MALSIRTPGLKLVWEADGLEIDLLPLQGLWTEEAMRALREKRLPVLAGQRSQV